ncbi:3-oxoacyl-[acyl-carrier-protein] reductase [Halanaerobiaceae bacterium Z-7014]|uniref:3-oxoacyl-[acyl-carrier-protein] reductase n=1 Tax=Halonatronomonas betaini TaxID=2778430 RepID=A0A931AQR4_9FIRM|nr:3-oxoacyl-[acyl-carrier-protein] reductase [Halonatronomonas betaini]MBF8436772.1 3-oxoacyl-[acyl-carrier-protein] reductase [Halonatronomonas betaini]
MINLNGKSAIITGSSRGIGAATAFKLAEFGANIVINHSSDNSKDRAEEIAESIKDKFDIEVIVIQADVSEKEEAEKLINESLQKFETIDILVNNAGINRDGLLMRMKPEEWQQVIDVNLTGIFNVCNAVIRPMMKARAGKIINMSSIVGITGNAGQTNYSASKAGIIGFTKSLAQEVASRGITVNAVAPGLISTEMTDEMPEKALNKMKENIPLNRSGDPEEIANTVAFLASDLSSYITGEVIKVTGGLGM